MANIIFNVIGLLSILFCYVLFNFEITALVLLFLIYSELKDD